MAADKALAAAALVYVGEGVGGGKGHEKHLHEQDELGQNTAGIALQGQVDAPQAQAQGELSRRNQRLSFRTAVRAQRAHEQPQHEQGDGRESRKEQQVGPRSQGRHRVLERRKPDDNVLEQPAGRKGEQRVEQHLQRRGREYAPARCAQVPVRQQPPPAPPQEEHIQRDHVAHAQRHDQHIEHELAVVVGAEHLPCGFLQGEVGAQRIARLFGNVQRQLVGKGGLLLLRQGRHEADAQHVPAQPCVHKVRKGHKHRAVGPGVLRQFIGRVDPRAHIVRLVQPRVAELRGRIQLPVVQAADAEGARTRVGPQDKLVPHRACRGLLHHLVGYENPPALLRQPLPGFRMYVHGFVREDADYVVLRVLLAEHGHAHRRFVLALAEVHDRSDRLRVLHDSDVELQRTVGPRIGGQGVEHGGALRVVDAQGRGRNSQSQKQDEQSCEMARKHAPHILPYQRQYLHAAPPASQAATWVRRRFRVISYEL